MGPDADQRGGATLSEGAAGSVHGGDRLPYVRGDDGTDNFAPLQSLDWQIHVYGDISNALRAAAEDARLPLHAFPWTLAAETAGLEREALYLIRPDGYVALADAGQDTTKLTAYLDRFAIKPRSG